MNFPIIKIDETEYVNCELIMEKYSIYTKGIRNTRSLIKVKNIPLNMYVFARKNDNTWFKTEGKSIKYDKVLLNKNYFENIPELQKDNHTIDNNTSIEKAPPIIELNNTEKFKDLNGIIIEIETRGTRKFNDMYFKVKDVSIGLKLIDLHTNIIDVRKGYTFNKDYKYFICDTIGTKKNTKELFLTYSGILRVLFVSVSGKANEFIKWATETLFTVQMGSNDQKQQLVSNIMGVSAQAVKEVFKVSSKSVPCVYLFSLGFVKDLRNSMNINEKYTDDMLVCKYGYTIDLSRRTNEHIKTYGNITGVDLKLKSYSYIDPIYCSNAETDIKDHFNALDIGLKFKDYEELVAIKPSLMKTVESQYKQISEAYAGHIKDMIKQVEDLKKELELQTMKHKNELLTMENELNMSNAKNNNLMKDLEIEKLRNQLLNMNKK